MTNKYRQISNRVLTLISKIDEIQRLESETGEYLLPTSLENIKQELMNSYAILTSR